MAQVKSLWFVIVALGVSVGVFAQEITLNLAFIQAGKLTVSGGGTLILQSGQSVDIGSDIVVKGGTANYNYSWKWNNEEIAVTKNYIVSATGTYIFEVHDANNCSASVNVEVSWPVEILSKQEPIIDIFPNPAAGNWYIKNNLGVQQTIDIVNMAGVVVFSAISGANETTHFSSGQLPAGLYYIILKGGESKTIKKLMIH